MDGDRQGPDTALWLDNTLAAFPDWVAVDFGATKTVGEIDVYTRQDDYINLVEPTATQTFSLYGVTAYDVQYWTGTAWATVPGGSVTNNNLVWRKFTFTPVTTQKIRVVVNAGADNVYSRLVEVEAYAQEQPGGQGEVKWLVTDHLGTPRMVADLSGSLAGIKRHDYLPFGEEIGAGTGGRTAAQGYSGSDNVRQKFAGKEHDAETGLDYFGARYMSSTQGRFTSVDPGPFSKRHVANPQKWNRYLYVLNNPLRFFDPDGMEEIELIIRTFIPQKSVTLPMPVKGDGRDVGERGTSRTEFRIIVETDIRKNNGNIFVGSPKARAGLSEGLTVKPMAVPGQGIIPVTGYGKSQVTQADIDNGTEATANRPLKDTIQVTATHAVAYPGAPGTPTIDYNLNLTVVDNNGKIAVSAEGMHDGFPAIEIFAVRQGSNQEQLINSYDPRDTGQSGFELIGKPDTKLERRTRELDPVRRP